MLQDDGQKSVEPAGQLSVVRLHTLAASSSVAVQSVPAGQKTLGTGLGLGLGKGAGVKLGGDGNGGDGAFGFTHTQH